MNWTEEANKSTIPFLNNYRLNAREHGTEPSTAPVKLRETPQVRQYTEQSTAHRREYTLKKMTRSSGDFYLVLRPKTYAFKIP